MVAKLESLFLIVVVVLFDAVGAFLLQSDGRQGRSVASPSPGPSPDTTTTGCDSNWMQTRDEYNAAMEVWTDPQCYDMVFARSCMCRPEMTGPFNVQVRNGVIVQPTNVEFLPTMQFIMDTIFQRCVENCPGSGAFSCNVDFGPLGNAANVTIDRDAMIADEEIYWYITDFEICN